jgi:hypothetical protein
MREIQQIIWTSKLLSTAEEHTMLEAILAKASGRYGKAEESELAFSGVVARLCLQQPQPTKVFIGYSWQAMGQDSRCALRSTAIEGDLRRVPWTPQHHS